MTKITPELAQVIELSLKGYDPLEETIQPLKEEIDILKLEIIKLKNK